MMDSVRATARWLAAIEFWVVAALAVSSVFFQRLSLPALTVAGVFWVVRWSVYGRPSVRTPADWPIGLLVLLVPVSLWATALPDVTRQQAYRLLIGIALYYSVVNWACSRVRLRWIASGLVAVGCALALSAPFSVQPFAGGQADFTRSVPSFARSLPAQLSEAINPNVMAGVLVILLPFAVGMLLFGWWRSGWPARILVGLAVFLMTLALYLTRSRGAVMGLCAAMLAMVALHWRRGWFLVLATSLAAILGGWLVGFDRIIRVLSVTPALGGLDVRLEVWSHALYMIRDFSFTGVGFGSFPQVASLLYPFYLVGPGTLIPHAHNLLLQIAVDLGLPGLVAWLATWLLTSLGAWIGYQQGKASGDDWLAGIGASLVAGQVALIVQGLSDAVTWGTRPSLLVWVIWGLAMASWLVCRENGNAGSIHLQPAGDHATSGARRG